MYTADLTPGSYRAALGIEVHTGVGLEVAATGTAFPSDLLAFAAAVEDLQDGAEQATFTVTTWHPWLEILLERNGVTVSGEIMIRLMYPPGRSGTTETKITFDQLPAGELGEIAKAFRYVGELILG